MTEAETKFLIGKIAALEILVENLVVDTLCTSGDPIAAGQDFLERVFASSIKNHNPALPTDVAETIAETIEGVVRRAMEKIQRQTKG